MASEMILLKRCCCSESGEEVDDADWWLMIKPLKLLWAYSISHRYISTNEKYARLFFQNGNQILEVSRH
ncbi:hypothetical protein VCRA2121O65_30048 [Vibrio crassostreae]|nr:hypothetical protein VCRA2116O26_30071 [Vibrio crassostreae]CAK2504537.1 hypothetical protein VCRA2116O33_30032 [Vibrio crassostreae]CAK2860853.1 hypothetical protein VCRA2125O82_20071 [Vibrio crassostreae]CAK2870660.1 hypothetical protein VCRA2119O42_30072 [Vibrio crassostreae]CAK3460729.1 hypothetical protein VCRA2122O73_30049 [Vibrio crassostreae]